MLHVFIDTNVFLNFYSFSSDRLQILEKFLKLMKEKKIKLYITDQVVNEFVRNRENKLKEVLDHLKQYKNLDIKSPVICHDFEEMKTIQELTKGIRQKSIKLCDELSQQIQKETLPADKLVFEILKNQDILEIGDDDFENAKRRVDLGNPPGKNGSYGDAVNWELLLSNVPEKTDLYFIGGDSDFTSAIGYDQFSPFLKDEWELLKESKIIFYRLISLFLSEKFPETNITKDEIKEEQKVVRIAQPNYVTIKVPKYSVPTQDWAKLADLSKALDDIQKRLSKPDFASTGKSWVPPQFSTTPHFKVVAKEKHSDTSEKKE